MEVTEWRANGTIAAGLDLVVVRERRGSINIFWGHRGCSANCHQPAGPRLHTVSQGRLQTSARTDERPRHDHDLFLAVSVRRDHALSFAAGS